MHFDHSFGPEKQVEKAIASDRADSTGFFKTQYRTSAGCPKGVMVYRIGVIDDFKNSYSFIQVQQYGDLKIWDGSNSSGPKPTYQKSDDAIWVFLNFKKVQTFHSRSAAVELIRRLIVESPISLKEVEHHLFY